jgi:hypothetical protein
VGGASRRDRPRGVVEGEVPRPGPACGNVTRVQCAASVRDTVSPVLALLTRGWKWFFGRKRVTAYYPDEEPKTRAERSHETLGWSDHATWGEGSRSPDERR